LTIFKPVDPFLFDNKTLFTIWEIMYPSLSESLVIFALAITWSELEVLQLRDATKGERVLDIVIGPRQGASVTSAVDVTRGQDVVQGVALAAHLHGQVQA
jgi:hypothetical protein